MLKDIAIAGTQLVVKIPTERLLTVNGEPQEDYVAEPLEEDYAQAVECVGTK